LGFVLCLIDFQMPVVSVLNPLLTGLAKYIEKESLIYDVELAEMFLRGLCGIRREVLRLVLHIDL